MIRKVQKVAASLPSYGFGMVWWFGPLVPQALWPIWPIWPIWRIWPHIDMRQVSHWCSCSSPFSDAGRFEVNRFPHFLSIRCEPLELCTGTFPNLEKLCLIHHARQARKDAEENVKQCLRCLLPLAHEQTKFLLNVTSVSRCCLMIALAIGPEPGPRITNLTLSSSPYNTGYAETSCLDQMCIAIHDAGNSSSYIMVS